MLWKSLVSPGWATLLGPHPGADFRWPVRLLPLVKGHYCRMGKGA